MKVLVAVRLKAGVLDPQGKAIGHALEGLGFTGVNDVRVGKLIELDLSETNPEAARAAAETMAHRLLTNAVIETYDITVS